MSYVQIMGVDPSLRNTGLAILEYNTQFAPNNPHGYKVKHCQVLANPEKYKGTDAILNMIDMMSEESKKDCYREAQTVLIESPPIMFNKEWGMGTISSIAHISGAAVPIFGVEKAFLFRPNEWNKSRKKEVTHKNITSFFGDHSNWHFENKIKSEKRLEHVIDAIGLAFWWIRNNYIEE